MGSLLCWVLILAIFVLGHILGVRMDKKNGSDSAQVLIVISGIGMLVMVMCIFVSIAWWSTAQSDARRTVNQYNIVKSKVENGYLSEQDFIVQEEIYKETLNIDSVIEDHRRHTTEPFLRWWNGKRFSKEIGELSPLMPTFNKNIKKSYKWENFMN